MLNYCITIPLGGVKAGMLNFKAIHLFCFESRFVLTSLAVTSFWMIKHKYIKITLFHTLIPAIFQQSSFTSRGRSSTSNVSENYFSGGIKKLVNRWNKCIDLKGDYIEKNKIKKEHLRRALLDLFWRSKATMKERRQNTCEISLDRHNRKSATNNKSSIWVVNCA